MSSPSAISTVLSLRSAGDRKDARLDELAGHYRAFRNGDAIDWASNYGDLQLVGSGGQGLVFRCERTGADDFRLPLALKIFSPEVYSGADDYEADMGRVASVSMQIAQLQNHHLLDVHNFIERDRVRVMVMEWVNGYDLHHLLSADVLEMLRVRVAKARWVYLNDVVITEGRQQSRLKPGVAIEILRGCLDGLASLHRAGVAHGDIKPSNIMLKRTGSVKLVDFGSAVDLKVPESRIAWTPTYAAPELLDGGTNSPRSDLASLGYVLVEMLSGRQLFGLQDPLEKLRATKLALPAKLPGILPPDVARNREMVKLCQALVHPDPVHRMASAEEANLVWAANLHRQLVKTDLDSEYENDIRVWMECLPPHYAEKVGADPAETIAETALSSQSTLVA